MNKQKETHKVLQLNHLNYFMLGQCIILCSDSKEKIRVEANVDFHLLLELPEICGFGFVPS